MAGRVFGEAELARLKVLAGRVKADGKLEAGERLELRELKARRQAAEAAVELAKIAARKRKAEDRRKYELGGLVAKAGLADWSAAELLGGLRVMVRANPQMRAVWARETVEREQTEAEAAARAAVTLRVRFAEDPGEAMRTALHRRGFVFDSGARAWSGKGDPAEIEAEAALAGGTVERIK
jgi:hypothetical protein